MGAKVLPVVLPGHTIDDITLFPLPHVMPATSSTT